MFFPVNGDRYLNNVILHLPMIGENNSTSFIDVSPSPKTVTVVGNTKISTAQSVYGLGSGAFDGSTDKLIIDHNSLKSNSSNFAVELWVYVISHKNYTVLICTQSGNSYVDGYTLGLDSIGRLFIYTNTFEYFSTTTIPLMTWKQVSMVRLDNVCQFFIHGTPEASTWTTNKVFSGGPFIIGGIGWNTEQSINGYIQDVRYTSLARYTNAYAVSFRPLPTRFPELNVRQIQQSSFHTAARLGL